MVNPKQTLLSTRIAKKSIGGIYHGKKEMADNGLSGNHF
jgi:hypothetical protein